MVSSGLFLLPGLAAAQDRPGFWDYFTFDALTKHVMQSAVMALRTLRERIAAHAPELMT